MSCFVCKKEFDHIDILMHHLRKKHDLNSNSTFRCFDKKCSLLFMSSSSYKRHIRRLHVKAFKPTEVEKQITPNAEKINESSVLIQNEIILDSSLANSASTEINCGKEKVFEKEIAIKKLLESALKWSISLHSNDNFSRKDVYEIQKGSLNFIIKPLLEIFDSFARCKLQSNEVILNEICSVINACTNPFEKCDSDYLLTQCLRKGGYMDDVNEFVINNEININHRNGELNLQEVINKAVVLPLRSQFRALFETENFLSNMLSYMKSLEKSNQFINFVQAELWKTKCKLYPNKILVPYYLYADEFEINNPLGSHSSIHSICNFYYSFACMPLNEAKLENIFLAAAIKSKDIKKYGNEKCLQPLINELKFLEEEGILVRPPDGDTFHVHFILGLILGDNLGLNTLLGFSKSFSGTFCRFCRLNKDECSETCTENSDKRRNISNYNFDLQKNNPKETGINSECCFNDIPSFHVVENFSVDVMHDIFEGICHYDLCHVIIHFTQIKKYFSLETLNKRKQTFEYGPIEIGNASNEIHPTHLKKRHLRMSAREMLTFAQLLPLMVGDMVPLKDDVWNFLLNLLEIINIVLCFEISDESISTLRSKIKTHNEQYLQLFQDKLKPKFHIITHYPTILQKSGPLRKYWCFKYEAKHKSFKLYAHAITSRKNICLTLAKKFQLKFANRILNFKYNTVKCVVWKKHNTPSGLISLISNKLEVQKERLNFWCEAEYNGIEYKSGYYVSRLTNDYNIYVIINFVQNEEDISLFCQKLNEIHYRPHYMAFEVDASFLGEYFILHFEELIGPPATVIKTPKGKTMMHIKEYFLP